MNDSTQKRKLPFLTTTVSLLMLLALSAPVTANNYIDPTPGQGNGSSQVPDIDSEEGTEGEEGAEGEEGEEGTEGEEEVIEGFQDIEGHWAEEIILDLYGRGLVAGVNEFSFAPDHTMSRAEFLTVVVRYVYPTAVFHDGSYWYSGYFSVAEAEGVLPMTFREKNMESPITRQEMAYIMVEALGKLGEYPEQLLNTKQIPDYNTVTTSYQSQVLTAYSMGMVGGKSDGSYAPHDTATRAECAVVLQNMVDPTSRIEVEFQIDPNTMTDMNRLDVSYTKSRDNLSYSSTDPERPIAKVGDTVLIGTSEVVIEAHPSLASVNGMPVPYVAGVALDSGINTNSSYGVVGDGFTGGGVHYNGDTYYINPLSGDGYWESQWKALQVRVPAPRAFGQVEGEVSTDDYKLWTWSVEDRAWIASYLYGRES